MNAIMTRIFASLELEQQLAIQALEERGLVWGTHFTSATAERVRRGAAVRVDGQRKEGAMITVNLEAGDLAQKVAEALAIMLPGEERLLTISQAAERLAIGETTMHNMISAGDIPTVGEGKLRRIRYGALVEWMRANEKRA